MLFTKVHKRHFFSNFGAIAAFAVLGTLLSTLFVGLALFGLSRGGLLFGHDELQLAECLTFGALISATDPVSTLAVFAELKVDPNLFYLVFGESVGVALSFRFAFAKHFFIVCVFSRRSPI
jgi:sodium/hydrogen exchanger 8